MKQKAIFLDRDGTINVDFGYLYKPEQLEFLPGAIEAMQIFRDLGYLLVVITNQSGIGRGYYTLEDAERFNEYMSAQLVKEGIEVADYFVCPHAPTEDCHCRKPHPTMVLEALAKYDIDPAQSYMFGDKQSDVDCGEAAGVRSFRITAGEQLIDWAGKLKEGNL